MPSSYILDPQRLFSDLLVPNRLRCVSISTKTSKIQHLSWKPHAPQHETSIRYLSKAHPDVLSPAIAMVSLNRHRDHGRYRRTLSHTLYVTLFAYIINYPMLSTKCLGIPLRLKNTIARLRRTVLSAKQTVDAKCVALKQAHRLTRAFFAGGC